MADDESFSVDAGILSVNKDLDELAPGRVEGAAAGRCLHGGRSLTIRAKGNVATMLERMGLGVVARVKAT